MKAKNKVFLLVTYKNKMFQEKWHGLVSYSRKKEMVARVTAEGFTKITISKCPEMKETKNWPNLDLISCINPLAGKGDLYIVYITPIILDADIIVLG